MQRERIPGSVIAPQGRAQRVHRHEQLVFAQRRMPLHDEEHVACRLGHAGVRRLPALESAEQSPAHAVSRMHEPIRDEEIPPSIPHLETYIPHVFAVFAC